MNIILTGFMGSGKSTVGQLLAAQLQLNYLDTDELIEQTEERSISEIFQADGEPYFRDLETEVLKTLENYDNFVLATGGGIVLKAENVERLKKMGPVVLLWAEPEVIYQRVKKESQRPLLKVADPETEIKSILQQREPFYRQAADYTVDTSDLLPPQVSEEIFTWLKSK